MKQILLILAGVMVGCGGGKEPLPLTKEESAKIIEAAIRKALTDNQGKHERLRIAGTAKGELTKADLEKVTRLSIKYNRLRDVKGLEKLTKLKSLSLPNNQLTDVKGLENLTQL